MSEAPGPEDPRYWERLRRGPPLDEWRSPDAHWTPKRYGARAWLPIIAVIAAVVGVVWWVNRGGADQPLTFADMPLCTQPVSQDPCRDGQAVVYGVGASLVTFPTYEQWLAYVRDSAAGQDPEPANPTGP